MSGAGGSLVLGLWTLAMSLTFASPPTLPSEVMLPALHPTADKRVSGVSLMSALPAALAVDVWARLGGEGRPVPVPYPPNRPSSSTIAAPASRQAKFDVPRVRGATRVHTMGGTHRL